MPIQSLQVPQSQFNAELQNITNQTNDLIALGVPQNLAQSYGDNASVAAMNPNSIYYTGGLSATPAPGSQAAFDNQINTLVNAQTNGIDIRPAIAKLSDLKNWSVSRAAVIIVGGMMIFASIMMLSTKETINIAPTVAKTVAENPEMVA